MPLKGVPVCLKCDATESPLWTNAENLGAVCLSCVNEARDGGDAEDEDEGGSATTASRKKRRAQRAYKTRLNPFALPKSAAPKGRGRRSALKRATPQKAPEAVATTVTSDYVFYKGSYIQVGDIVSLMDEEDNVYYAQIRGLLTDQYCEKSAVITWLLPTQESPPPSECFDPATYIIGPEEEIPRKLECMEFVMHAPSDYYKAKNTPYPHVPSEMSGFIWTTLSPVSRSTA